MKSAVTIWSSARASSVQHLASHHRLRRARRLALHLHPLISFASVAGRTPAALSGQIHVSAYVDRPEFFFIPARRALFSALSRISLHDLPVYAAWVFHLLVSSRLSAAYSIQSWRRHSAILSRLIRSARASMSWARPSRLSPGSSGHFWEGMTDGRDEADRDRHVGGRRDRDGGRGSAGLGATTRIAFAISALRVMSIRPLSFATAISFPTPATRSRPARHWLQSLFHEKH
mgnify:CR=1 FL=1